MGHDALTIAPEFVVSDKLEIAAGYMRDAEFVPLTARCMVQLDMVGMRGKSAKLSVVDAGEVNAYAAYKPGADTPLEVHKITQSQNVAPPCDLELKW
jgi:hypothetical protein